MMAISGFIRRGDDNHPKKCAFHPPCYIVARAGVFKADADQMLVPPSLTSQPQEA